MASYIVTEYIYRFWLCWSASCWCIITSFGFLILATTLSVRRSIWYHWQFSQRTRSDQIKNTNISHLVNSIIWLRFIIIVIVVGIFWCKIWINSRQNAKTCFKNATESLPHCHGKEKCTNDFAIFNMSDGFTQTGQYFRNKKEWLVSIAQCINAFQYLAYTLVAKYITDELI